MNSCFVKGHGFGRAEDASKSTWALAAAEHEQH
jgi:hypothetical protein